MSQSPTPSWSSEYARVPQIVGSSDSEEWTCWQGESKQAKSKCFRLPRPYLGFLQKESPRLEMGLHLKSSGIKGVSVHLKDPC